MKRFHKTDLTDIVAVNQNVSKKQAAEHVDAVLDALAQLLDTPGKSVQLRDFGTFHCKIRAARTGRNPQTGAPVQIAAKQTITFKPSKALTLDLVL